MTKEEAIKILQGIDRLIGDDFYSDTTEEAVEMAIEALQAPPISQRKMYQAGYRQAQEDGPKGHWKIYGIYDSKGRRTGDLTIICDRCSTREVIHFGRKTWDFCPNCGAKMDGERRE